ncbi:MAG TPA: ABC transporter permease subunit [Acidimicrobiales bacterium]|nr:ABC transporter permease subunit [Acidimicrobiales bacterium]
MTTTTVPVGPANEAESRSLPWSRMGWVCWRHHRVALAGVVAFLCVLGLWLWIAGLQLHRAYAAALACHPISSNTCQNVIATFQSTNVILKGGFVLQALPALMGAFVGAPMLAREMDAGTFRFAWTQGIGRRRWTVAKLVLVGLAVTAIAGAFSVLISWYYQPYLAAGDGTVFSSPSPLSPGLFDLRGVAFAAWTLVAFAIGAFAGMLTRRVVPAIVTTLAGYTGLALLTANVLRQHYLAPLVAKGASLANSAWITSEWWTKGGSTAFSGRPPVSLLEQLCPASFVPGPHGGIGIRGTFSPTACLVHHGYTQWSDYQPASHFWAFQWIEGGWLLALSWLLFVATVWLVRRRAA